MIPQVREDLLRDFTEAEPRPSQTYYLEVEKDRVRGWTEGLDAVRQAVYKILHTERYDHVIYSWNYGVELTDLFGAPVSYAIPELRRRITEALTWDDRVESVDTFEFVERKGRVRATFTAHTIYGDLREEMEVDIRGGRDV